MATIGEKLRAFLERKGFTVASVAENSGMLRQQIEQVLSGKRPNPSLRTIQRIVEAADGTLGEFFSEEDEP